MGFLLSVVNSVLRWTRSDGSVMGPSESVAAAQALLPQHAPSRADALTGADLDAALAFLVPDKKPHTASSDHVTSARTTH